MKKNNLIWTYILIWISNSNLKDIFVSSRTDKLAFSFHCCRDGRVGCPFYHSIHCCICKGTKQNREKAKNRYPQPRYHLNLCPFCPSYMVFLELNYLLWYCLILQDCHYFFVDHSDESRTMVVEQEDCSFHHPEQEQGGSSASINTQDSESKLIVWLYWKVCFFFI